MKALRVIAAAGAVALPTPVWAHTLVPGIGGAYAAFAHTVTEPPAPFALLALGLLFGVHGASVFKWAWLSFFAAMIVGVVSTLAIRVVVDPELPLVLVALTAGLLAAAALPLPVQAAAGLGSIAGYFFGVFGTPAPASWSTTAYFVTGAMAGANLTLVFVVAGVEMIRQQWQQKWIAIGFRVIASWIAAISVLMLALSMQR
ncbi:MAG: HupE/UreJ family protein [Hyphomicrobiaceae bacterium]